MELTSAQRATLRTAILAEPSLTTAVAQGNDVAVADWLNGASAPAFFVWQNDVTPDALLQVVVWTEVDSLTNGRARIFDWMTRLPRIDFGIARYRAGLQDCFGAGSVSLTNLTEAIKRVATRAEALLANTAVGNGSEATPARLRAFGPASTDDVSLILRG